jgi:hypothetical protein
MNDIQPTCPKQTDQPLFHCIGLPLATMSATLLMVDSFEILDGCARGSLVLGNVMNRYRWAVSLAILLAVAMVTGCGGSNGSPGPAPTNVSAEAGDGQATLSWTATPGVYDWLWLVQSDAGVTIGSSGNATNVRIGVTPPYVMAGLTIGLPYSFALNGHSGNVNGPGGPQSASVTVTPRLAETWTACSANCPTSSVSLFGVAFGDNNTAQANGESIHTYLAVGSGGAMFTSPDAQTWTALPSQSNCTPASSGSLRAADYGWRTFVAVGDSGTICFSGPTSQNSSAVPLVSAPDPATANWFKATTSPLSTTSGPNLYAVATNQSAWNASAGSHVAVGSGGTVIRSSDGQNWTLSTATSATTSDLYAVSYNLCGLAKWYWVAVGASGTILATSDTSGATGWTTVSSGISSAIRGIACTPNSTPSALPGGTPATTIPLWVAVGDGGVLLTSTDGMNWSTPANFTVDGANATSFPGNVNVQKVIFGSQFVAIGDGGKIYTSLDGAAWITQASGIAGNLYGLAQTQGNRVPNGTFGVVPYGYSAVGAGGITTFGH